ncbi:MAG: hypothetical protein JSR21_17600 [Proteobacteria bacterium]|nr:hypothetical protein [Pseudomonadota bacterium]
MMARLPPAARRAIALGVLVLLVAAGWLLVAQPLIDLSASRLAEIGALSERLALQRAIIARAPVLQRRAAADRGALDATGGLWKPTGAAELAAGMQERLRPAISGTGGRLRSTAVVAEAEDHGLRRVTVHFSIEGSLQTIQATLAATEAARPAMFVLATTIHAAPVNAMMGPAGPPPLTMEMDIGGFMPGPAT